MAVFIEYLLRKNYVILKLVVFYKGLNKTKFVFRAVFSEKLSNKPV